MALPEGMGPSIVICVVAFFCYYNALKCGFVFDDISAIKDNKDLRPTTPLTNLFWNDFWGTPMIKERSHKSYRPLCVLTFRWNYMFGELEPCGYHLVNVLLHVIVCVLYLRFCKMFMSCTTSFIATLLFAIHPVHTEAVTGVVGRAELLSSIFVLCAMFTYTKCTGLRSHTDWRQLLLTVIMVTIAMLCKEQGITVIGVCCVYEIFVAQRLNVQQLYSIMKCWMTRKSHFPPWLWQSVFRTVVLVGSTVCLLLLRVKIMGAQLPVFTKFDNPAAASDTPTRQLTYNYLLPVNIWLLLYPSALCCDWTMGTIPLVESISDPRNLATLLFYAVICKLSLYAINAKGEKSRALIISLAMLVLPFVPASNLFFPVGFVVAERILYSPSMGFCMLLALGFEQLLSRNRRLKPLMWFGLSILLVSHSMKTISRNTDWESEYSLFLSALKVNTKNAKLYNNVGHALENLQQHAEALKYFKQAAIVQPDDIGSHINVGRAYKTLEYPVEAEQAFRRALDLFPPVIPGQSYTARVAPNHLNVFINLGTLIAKDDSRLAEADSLYRSAIGMRADYTQAYINHGDILMRMNRSREAQEQYEKALKYDSENPDIHFNLGVVLLERGYKLEALRSFNEALQLDSGHRQSLFNSAVLIQELGDPKLRTVAITRLQTLVELEPENEKIYFNLGMLAMDNNDFSQAESWFFTAAKSIEDIWKNDSGIPRQKCRHFQNLKEDFRSALFNLALLLVNDLQRPLDAVPVLQQLLKFYPEHTKGLILMGDININHLKDVSAAEENFSQILAIEPGNVQANHNLCVVYVEQGLLEKAEQCLIRASQLAPEEEYIQRHLAIVQSRIQKSASNNAAQNGRGQNGGT